MLAGIRSSLQLRMMILAGTGLLVAYALFAGLSVWAVEEGVNRTVEERRILARTLADRVAYLLQNNLDVLQGVAFAAQFGPGRAEVEIPARALHDGYLHSLFTGGVYLLDARAEVLRAEPQSQVSNSTARQPYVSRAIEAGRPIVTDLYRTSPSGKPIVSALIPLRNGVGDLVGVLGGDMDAADRRIQEMIQPTSIGSTGYVQLVDSAGNVFAGRGAGQPAGHRQGERLAAIISKRQPGTATCHDCHQTGGGLQRQREVIAFAPVSGTPWSVVIRQAEEEALLPLHRLRQVMLFVGLPLFLVSLAVAWGTARSVVRPLKSLGSSAERIAGGDLSSPVPVAGEDEIGYLARTFEVMRVRLQQSLLRIQGWNAELEERVRQRTVQLQEQERLRRQLLRQVISAQEEERRRIARELHDETSQSLAALILALDTASLAAGKPGGAHDPLGAVKALAVRILDSVHELIYDLRPSLLDDLGLVAALRWYAESRLGPAGVTFSVEITGEERRLPPEVETALFRALQEAITNVAKHAAAETAVVRLDIRDDGVVAEVEDDGRGFDPAGITPQSGAMQGIGLLGMSERIGLLQGHVSVISRPGNGTRVRFEVPLATGGEHDEQDPCALSR